MGLPRAGASAGIAEHRKTAVGAGLAWELRLHHLYSRIPPVPAPTFAPPRLQRTHPCPRKRPHRFRHMFLYWHGYTPITGTSGCSRGSGGLSPCAKRMSRSSSCLDAVCPGGAPWCCCPPFAGRAGPEHSSLPPSAAWG